MSSSLPARPPSPEIWGAPAQVWAALSTDLRTRAIGLLAQLALNVIIARTHTELGGGETSNAYAPEHAQNPL